MIIKLTLNLSLEYRLLKKFSIIILIPSFYGSKDMLKSQAFRINLQFQFENETAYKLFKQNNKFIKISFNQISCKGEYF